MIGILLGMNSGRYITPSVVNIINTHRTRDVGVFIFNYSNSAKSFRIFAPWNDRYAQYWTLKKEASASSEYYEFTGEQGITEYFELIAPTSRTGTWSSFGTSSTSYASSINATLSFSFNGTGFKTRHYSDNRGGILRFVIDGTTIVDISTYNSVGEYKEQEIIDGLNYGTHSVVVTFTGDDPLNPPSGGVSRGWLCTNYTATNKNQYDRPIFVYGSNSPNFCYPTEQDLLGSTTYHYSYSLSSHREYAVATRIEGSATSLSDGWIPLHGITGNATIFNNLSTDRRLYLSSNESTNLIDGSNAYTLAVGSDSLVMYQKFIGYNRNGSSSDHLFDVEQTWTWTSSGLNIKTRMETLNELDHNGITFYISMLDADVKVTNAGFEYVIMSNGDELPTDGIDSTYDLYSKSQLQSGIWNGDQFCINKNGNSLEKSVVQALSIKNPLIVIKFNKNYDQAFMTWQDAGGHRRKNYYVMARGSSNADTIPIGEVWEWECDWVMGIVPDAYNVLKP